MAAAAFPGIGSYLSVPIRRSDGSLYGTLCAIDPEPRHLSPQQTNLLMVLAPFYAADLEREEELTRRATAEAALRDNEERLRALIAGSQDLLVVVDAAGCHAFVNPAYAQLIGAAPNALIGQPFGAQVHPDDRSQVTRVLGDVARRPGATIAFDARFVDATGNPVATEVLARNELHRATISGIVLNARDVTRRKAAELERSHLASIVESAQSPVFVVDLASRVLSWNPAAVTEYGIPMDQAVGQPLPDLAPGGDEDVLPAALQRVFAGEHLPYVGTRHEDRDGTIHELALTISPIRDTAAVISGASVIARDVTDLYQARNEAERLEAQSRAMLDATSDGMLMVGGDGLLLRANRAAGEWFAFDPDPLLCQPVSRLLAELRRTLAEPDLFDQMVLEAIADPQRAFTAAVEQRWPVTRELTLYSATVLAPDGEHLGRIFVLHDVSHVREVDRTKSEFVSLVSHELRTPLTSIKGFIDLLLDEESLDISPDHREFLTIIQTNADRLVALVDDLLEVSRLESGRVELDCAKTDLGGLVARVAASLQPQLNAKQQQLVVQVAGDLPPVWADANRIIQVLTNLISNANNYTPSGGTIRINVRAGSDGVRTDVADNGIGMSPEELDQLFTKFFRARNQTTLATRGTGLGLAITKMLLEMHGGAISVDSVPGQDTTITVTLPFFTDPPEPEIDPESEPKPGAASLSKAIILVTGDTIIGRSWGAQIGATGSTILTVSTAADARELAAVEQPAALLLDVATPDLDLATALVQFQADAKTSHFPVTLMSLQPDQGDGAGPRLTVIGALASSIAAESLTRSVSRLICDSPGATVLVADNDETSCLRLTTALECHGYQVEKASNAAEASGLAAKTAPVLAFLDVHLPPAGGAAAIPALQQAAGFSPLPMVLLLAVAEGGSSSPATLPALSEMVGASFSLNQANDLVAWATARVKRR